MQNNMNAELSICIPTYNRAEKLKNGLEHLIPLARRYNIPIYVSDNASPDDTFDSVKKCQQSYQFLFYSRNQENYGADRNFEIVLKMSKSRYAWLFSDDDRFADDALGNVLGIITRGKHDLILVNGGAYNIKSRVIDGRVRDVKSKIYTDRNELLAQLAWHMTWMSCLIYSQDLIQRGDFKKFYGSYLVQVATILDFLSDKKFSVLWESRPAVYCTSDEIPSWYSKAFEIWVQSWINVISSLPQSFSQEAKDKCIMAHGVKSGILNAANLIELKRHDCYNLAIYRDYKHYFSRVTNLPDFVMFCCAISPFLGKWANSVAKRIDKFRPM